VSRVLRPNKHSAKSSAHSAVLSNHRGHGDHRGFQFQIVDCRSKIAQSPSAKISQTEILNLKSLSVFSVVSVVQE
jgi:hypothetical protein